ncbi:MAG: sulfite exporter TauE/SafE family protein [Thermoplasmata archaeon]|nr:sulfite exporter TauE/SafE family protein [Thermoplasmata archaeon]
MGYGTTLAPLLIMFGYEPLAIVPAILLSEALTGFFAAFAHHGVGNVNFNRDGKELRIAITLGACSVFGVVASVLLAISLPKSFITFYIGFIVLLMGILILWKRRKVKRFSWPKIIGIGTWASFNKGMSGGGYGPLVTSGQILSGVETKKSIAITSLSEGITSVAGFVVYLILGISLAHELVIPLVIGAMLSVPFSALAVKRVREKKLLVGIGAATLVLGIFTLLKASGML